MPLLLLFLCAWSAAGADPLFDKARVVLAQNCVRCHGGEAVMGSFDMTSAEKFAASKKAARIVAVVSEGKMPFRGAKLATGQIDDLRAWVEAGAAWPAGVALTATAAAAKKTFWAFVPPVKAAPPTSAANPIDAFVLAKLEAKGLKANARADDRTLIRRLSFDLTGLPPAASDYALTYEQAVDQYLRSPHYGERWARHWLDVVRFGETDGGEHNYERLHAWPYRDYVIRAFNEDKPYDRFLTEQLTGDLMAPADPRMVAATGFLTAGPWDQVQAEINKDKAMVMTQRMDELDDMVTTTFHTFQALTVNCARCHDHKFDPIPTRDYYALTSVFQGVGFGTRRVTTPERQAEWETQTKPLTRELGRVRTQLGAIENPVKNRLARVKYMTFDEQRAAERQRIPLNPVYNRNAFAPVRAKHFRLVISGSKRPKIEALELRPAGARLEKWASPVDVSPDTPAVVEIAGGTGEAREMVWSSNLFTGGRDEMVSVYRLEASDDGASWRVVCSSLDHVQAVELDLPPISDEEIVAELTAGQKAQRAALLAERAALDRQLKAIGDLPQVYATKPVAPQPSFVLERGSVSKPGAPVTPGALSALAHQRSQFAMDGKATDAERRVALAKWLTDAKNPLTARVIVNRAWYFHFGNGIVNTPSDFGVAGDRPSHPELLDWLAVSLAENGWSLKWLQKQIVMSETYRQSSAVNAAAVEQDADNRLYWRMPLRRMDAETLRDSLLVAAGNLDLSHGGGPSYFLQKKGGAGSYIYKAVESEGPETWKRGVYRFVVRGGERLMLDSFDCPDPAVATPQRSVSNTPVQALTLLNNPFVLQQAGFLARRIEREAGGERAAQVRRTYEILFGRSAGERELALGEKFLASQPLALYCRTLLNTNEFLYVP